MTDKTTIDGTTPDGESHRRSAAGMLQGGRWMVLLRSVLSKTRLLHRVVRSLSKRVSGFRSHRQTFFSSLLLKTTPALMLAGIRCAGAGGGGPGH